MMCTSICDKPCSPQCVPYTPTTEEVRLDYAPAKTFPADAEEQFDRWLAEVKAQERKAERERTIKLLEANYTHNEDEFCIKCDIIALIKGEEQ